MVDIWDFKSTDKIVEDEMAEFKILLENLAMEQYKKGILQGAKIGVEAFAAACDDFKTNPVFTELNFKKMGENIIKEVTEAFK